MRILITGGAGFIGANLARRLVSDGVDVVVIDDLSTGYAENLRGLDVRFVKASITDVERLHDAMSGCTSVVHLAARGSVPRSIADPVATNRVNVDGTLAVLEAARAAGSHVVYSSSSSVYGANLQLPKHEEMRTQPMSPYAVSKLAAESYVLAYQRVFGLPTLAFRLFNVYGPLQAAGHAYAAVIPVFVDSLLARRPLRVHGDGLQSRDFTSVASVVSVLADAVTRQVVSDNPVNLAFGTSTTLLELVGMLEELSGISASVELVDARAGDVRASQAANSRLLDLFPGAAAQDLRDGLAATLAWFRAENSPAH